MQYGNYMSGDYIPLSAEQETGQSYAPNSAASTAGQGAAGNNFLDYLRSSLSGAGQGHGGAPGAMAHGGYSANPAPQNAAKGAQMAQAAGLCGGGGAGGHL